MKYFTEAGAKKILTEIIGIDEDSKGFKTFFENPTENEEFVMRVLKNNNLNFNKRFDNHTKKITISKGE